jgi:hypothetical protein
MSGFEVNDFSSPDETRTPPKTKVEVVKLANGEVGRFTFQPGWRWSECVKPLVVTDSCQVEHVGYVVSGRMRIEHDDGSSGEIGAGSVYRIAPGHDGEVLGDAPVVVVEFQSAAEYGRA